MLLSLFLFLFSFLLLLSLCLSIALFDIVVNERLVIGSRKEKIIKKNLDARNLTFNSFENRIIMLILLLSITVFQSVRQRGISFRIFTGKIFK